MTSYIKKPLILFVLLIILAPASSVLAQTTPPAERALEIVYPVFNDLTLTPTTGLPQYVQYLFRFAIAVIGIIILYVMISAGVTYTMSAGNAGQLLEAKNSMLASFLGAIILISAFVLFNSINPNLTKLGPIPDLTAIDPVVTPGIYLCGYNPNNVPGLINTAGNVQGLIALYKNFEADPEDRVTATRELRDVMSNDDGSCYRVKFSANLTKEDLTFRNDGNSFMFSIPQRIYDNPDTPNTNENNWEYEYGIIFHIEDNWKGRCSLNRSVASYLYPLQTSASSNPLPDFIQAKSVTLFKKPTRPINSSNKGISLFQCLDYSRTDGCPSPGLTGIGAYESFSVQSADYLDEVTRLELGNLAGSNGTITRVPVGGFGQNTSYINELTFTDEDKAKGARSIQIDPSEGAYFAIMFSGENYEADSQVCEVISKADNNLLDQPIGQCGETCKGIFDSKELLRDCVPCLKSMIVVKGDVIY